MLTKMVIWMFPSGSRDSSKQQPVLSTNAKKQNFVVSVTAAVIVFFILISHSLMTAKSLFGYSQPLQLIGNMGWFHLNSGSPSSFSHGFHIDNNIIQNSFKNEQKIYIILSVPHIQLKRENHVNLRREDFHLILGRTSHDYCGPATFINS